MMRVLGNHRVYFISALTSLIRPRHWVSRWIAAMARSSDTVRLKAVHASPWSLVGMPGRSGEELLWLVIQAAGVGIFETDLKLRRMRFSPELCELLGLPVGAEVAIEEALGFVHERDRSRMRASAKAAVDAAESLSRAAHGRHDPVGVYSRAAALQGCGRRIGTYTRCGCR